MTAIAALVLAIAAEVGVPPNFALAIALEENWTLNPIAVSAPNENGTRDLGIMQLNSAYFGHIDWRCPETNIRAGCLLIKELMGKPGVTTFWDVAICYNCGYGRFSSGTDPPAASIDYANRVYARWQELEGRNFRPAILKRQGETK